MKRARCGFCGAIITAAEHAKAKRGGRIARACSLPSHGQQARRRRLRLAKQGLAGAELDAAIEREARATGARLAEKASGARPCVMHLAFANGVIRQCGALRDAPIHLESYGIGWHDFDDGISYWREGAVASLAMPDPSDDAEHSGAPRNAASATERPATARFTMVEIEAEGGSDALDAALESIARIARGE